MSDVGCIGSILEDMIWVLKQMNSNDDLTGDKLRFGLILIDYLNQECVKNHIDLGIGEEYTKYIMEKVEGLNV